MDETEIRKLATLEDRHWWYQERRHLVRRAVRGIRPGRALDVGAAGGGNTRVLLDEGWSAVAVEYEQSGVGIAVERGVPVLRADARALPVGDEAIDLVIALDVLEHIADDASAAAELTRVLRPGGTALIAVPADMRLWSAHDEAVGHVRRYDRDELRTLVEDAGLTVDSLGSWNVVLRPAAKWHRRSSTGSDLDDVNPILNACLTGVIRAERYLPVGSLPGVSLVLRAHKRAA